MEIVKNRINGEKPEFGNLEHIAYCRKVERVFSGDESFHEIDWQFCHYWGPQLIPTNQNLDTQILKMLMLLLITYPVQNVEGFTVCW